VYRTIETNLQKTKKKFVSPSLPQVPVFCLLGGKDKQTTNLPKYSQKLMMVQYGGHATKHGFYCPFLPTPVSFEAIASVILLAYDVKLGSK